MKKTLFGLLLLCLPFLWACGDREQFVFEPLSHAELLRTCRDALKNALKNAEGKKKKHRPEK